jgi:uncharacterized protein YyaL (SSP411 family)
MSRRKPNRLSNEKSPYLLQHAFNPVDWYPWGDEAFEKARKEDKPIFLSIGYSTCHWCHVMERESFQDQEVAKLMNDKLISIKVDREERPDIDGVYMRVCQILTGSGGWPLTIIMTPEKKPFYAGTYIPKNSRLGLVGMIDLIPQINDYWIKQRERLLDIGENIIMSLKHTSLQTDEEIDIEVFDKCYKQLKSSFDTEHGGFGTAPKFPTPHNLLFLLRYWRRKGDKTALDMVILTLRKMRLGGIFDHIGYGFHRYSTEKSWLVPHFEKMLYDQALLTIAYSEAYSATGEEFFRETAEEIISYVLRDMSSSEGGFYSAEDADSEGVEGKFYVWSDWEISEILTESEAKAVKTWYNTDPRGNYFEESTRETTGVNILYLKKQVNGEVSKVLESARSKMFEAREKRVRPLLDDKQIVDWNGLMIASLAYAGRKLGISRYVNEAEKAADFVLEKLWDGKNLLHMFREEEASIPGFLNDYAFLIWGLIELYESTFETRFLKTAIDLNQEIFERFWDTDQGGFYFSGKGAEKLIVNNKNIYDGAIPSGNSVALMNLFKLARLTGNTILEEKAHKIISAFATSIKKNPRAYTFLLSALDFGYGPSYEIVIVGDRESEDTLEIIFTLNNQYLPNSVRVLKTPETCDLILYIRSYKKVKNAATVYVCKNFSCETPTNDIKVMLNQLDIKN